MSNKTNQNSFKTVTVAFLVLAILLSSGIAWGQSGGTITVNPAVEPVQIHALVLLPGASKKTYVSVNSAPCNHWKADGAVIGDPYIATMFGNWNGKITNAGTPLSNVETGGLSYPSSITVPSGGWVPHTVNFSASNVDDFWEYAIYGGYGKTSGASLSQNCHGHSTGAGYWLDDFKRLVDDDWTKYDRVGDLDSGAVYGDDGHSIRIDDVAITGTTYEITTSEKYRDSGVYTRKISPHGSGIGGSAEVALDLKIVKWNATDEWHSESVDPPFDHFYK